MTPTCASLAQLDRFYCSCGALARAAAATTDSARSWPPQCRHLARRRRRRRRLDARGELALGATRGARRRWPRNFAAAVNTASASPRHELAFVHSVCQQCHSARYLRAAGAHKNGSAKISTGQRACTAPRVATTLCPELTTMCAVRGAPITTWLVASPRTSRQTCVLAKSTSTPKIVEIPRATVGPLRRTLYESS